MENSQKGNRQLIISQLQDRIISMDFEIDKLRKDKELYLRIIFELSQEGSKQSISDFTIVDEISMVIIPSITPGHMEEDKKITRKKKEKKVNARQEAFERARAWALDRKRYKANEYINNLEVKL
jgi:hypothetical protein